jgi:molybdopterin synthase catalytic subunit
LRVKVRALSLLKDYIGEFIELEIEKGVTIRELVERLRVDFQIPRDVRIIAIVGNRVVDEDYKLLNEDVVVYLTPPFSGGGLYVDVRLLRQDEKVDLNAIVEKLSKIDLESGAISIFIGVVKGSVEGHKVHELVYESAEEAAIEQLKNIATEEGVKHGLSGVLIWHYTGARKPGEVTLIIATVGRSRDEAISAARATLERVKREVPIFKLEKREDGEYWIIGDSTRYLRRK